jgi:hypothetical protein
MAVLVFGFLLLLAAALSVGLGVGWLALLPVLLGLGVLGWGLLTVLSGRTPASAVRQTRSPELLGPGGPDDPDADRQ